MKLGLLEVLIVLCILNGLTVIFMAIGFAYQQFFAVAATTATLAAIFVWLNMNNEVLGHELRDFFRKKL